MRTAFQHKSSLGFGLTAFELAGAAGISSESSFASMASGIGIGKVVLVRGMIGTDYGAVLERTIRILRAKQISCVAPSNRKE